MSGWFTAQIVHTGRLPLFCFFVAFIAGFTAIRVSVRLIRAGVRWWPRNLTAGDLHVHHMVFGVVLMAAGGIAGLAAPTSSLEWRASAAGVFGLGTALVLDEFALILHLRDVYWANEGRLSVDAVFVAAGVTALLLLGASPVGVQDVAHYRHLPGNLGAISTLVATVAVLFALAVVTLLKGKPWVALIGIVIPLALLAGAVRLARPGSPWARWRYRDRPGKLARAARREERLRLPLIRAKNRLQDLLTGTHDQPSPWSARRQPPERQPPDRQAPPQQPPAQQAPAQQAPAQQAPERQAPRQQFAAPAERGRGELADEQHRS